MFTFNPSLSCNHINFREHALQRMVHQIKHAHNATQTWPFLSKKWSKLRHELHRGGQLTPLAGVNYPPV